MSWDCPVCSEPLEAAAPRCFRCETNLTPWWTLESSLRSDAVVPKQAEATHRPGGIATRWVVLVASAALAVGVVAGALLGRAAPATAASQPSPAIATATPPLAPTSPARTNVVEYHVQAGDTLWRIAAALSGDGRNWTHLWPARDRTASVLRRGTILRVTLDDAAAPER